MKEQFKKEVLEWLEQNNIFPKRVKVYDSKRYGLEVRLYSEPMEITNTRRSTLPDRGDGLRWIGIRTRKISNYVHINKDEFDKDEERQFILDTIRFSNI
jgi:hypothetical protein